MYAMIDDITLKSRWIIMIIRLLIEFELRQYYAFKIQILQECGMILFLGGKKCNQNFLIILKEIFDYSPLFLSIL